MTNPQLSWRELLPKKYNQLLRVITLCPFQAGKVETKVTTCLVWTGRTQLILQWLLIHRVPMSDAMLIDILTETKGIMDQYTDFKIHLFRFDTEVQSQEFTEHNMDES